MSGFTLEIRLDAPEAAFAPGAMVSGTALIQASRAPWRTRGADLFLFWRACSTERMTDTHGIACRVRLLGAGAVGTSKVSVPFSMRLPQLPWSYDGEFLFVTWYVGLYVKPFIGREDATEIEITVRPKSAHSAAELEGYN